MPAVADIKDELNDLTTLKFISSAFTEASAVKIKNIRAAFERNRQFWNEISHVYHLVRLNALKLKRKMAKGTTSSVEKTLSVAITSNQRFYGNLNINIMKMFVAETAKIKTDLMIVGNTGIEFMCSARLGRPYKSINFSRDNPDQQEIRSFLDSISEYDKIFVYYPKFVTLLTQTVGVVDITQTASPKGVEPEEEIHLIFEPELSKMIEFFERQIRSLLFLRVMLETDLARTAARLIAMSAAEERADFMIKEKKIQLRKTLTSFVNARLLETFAAIKKWKN